MVPVRKRYIAFFSIFLAVEAAGLIITLLYDEFLFSDFLYSALMYLSMAVPAFLFLLRRPDLVQVGLKEMFFTKIKWKDCLWILGLFAALLLYACLVVHKRWGSIDVYFEEGAYLSSFLTGTVEELFYRGLLLNITLGISKRAGSKWLFVALNAVLFMLVHIPYWLMSDSAILWDQCVKLIVLAVIQSLPFLKTKNIIPSMALHIFHNTLIDIFIL